MSDKGIERRRTEYHDLNENSNQIANLILEIINTSDLLPNRDVLRWWLSWSESFSEWPKRTALKEFKWATRAHLLNSLVKSSSATKLLRKSSWISTLTRAVTGPSPRLQIHKQSPSCTSICHSAIVYNFQATYDLKSLKVLLEIST